MLVGLYTYKLVAHGLGLLLESDFVKHLWEFIAYIMMTLSVASLVFVVFCEGYILDLLVRITYSGYTRADVVGPNTLILLQKKSSVFMRCVCDGAT